VKVRQYIVVAIGVVLTIILISLRSKPISHSPLDDLRKVTEKSLSESELNRVNDFENRLKDDHSAGLLDSLIDFWQNKGNLPLAGFYAFQKGKSTRQVEDWKTAGNLLFEAVDYSHKNGLDDNLSYYLIESSEKCLEEVLKIKPDDLDVKVQLAENYILNKGEIMSGVPLLLEVVRADSLNIEANMRLAKLSMFNGQYEKAILRMKTVLRENPENLEALYIISNAYYSTGDDATAIEYLQKALPLANDEMKIEIENRLIELKK
jgi:tetratricopeptide (TPR) repeat protein